MGVLLIGRVWRTAKRRKRTCVGALRSKRGSCSSGGVWRTAKRDSTGYFSYPPSTPPPSLHELLFIHLDLLQPPRAPVHPASTVRYSTGYCSTTPPPPTVHPALHTTRSCSTTPPRAPLHRLLFILPSTPWGHVHPPLHGHPSTVYCSSCPPPHHGVLFIQRQHHGVLFIHPYQEL